jgi:hypothetical protein
MIVVHARPFGRLISTAALVASALVASMLVPAPALAVSIMPQPQNKDSIDLRKDLDKRIARFHRTWRDAWKQSLIDRGLVNINLTQTQNDYNFRNFTPEVRRYQALLCYTGWLGEADMANAEARLYGTNITAPVSVRDRPSIVDRQVAASAARSAPSGEDSPAVSASTIGANALSLENPRRVRGDRNKGQVCPMWVPEEIGIPLDEGERLDLALPIGIRPIVRRARDTVITRLTQAAQRYPHDGWISGQLVRFLIDNADFDRALEAARACTSDNAWCAALEGLVYEQSFQPLNAERAFRRSVEAERSSAGVMCADTTVLVLLPAGPRREARGLPCEVQAEISERVWWMSDPLWSVPGNERFVAHYARRTHLALRSSFDEDERYVWRAVAAGEALQETIIRYGWPTHTYWAGYQMDSAISIGRESVMMQAEPPYTSKEYAPDRVTLLPEYRAINNPFESKATDWPFVRPDTTPLDEWWPTEHVAFPRRIATMPDGQSLLLRRDSAVLFGIAIDDPVHQLDPRVREPIQVSIVASTSPVDIQTIAETTLPPGVSLRANGLLKSAPSVVSVEVPGRVPTEIDHRTRFGLTPPPSLSEMLSGEVGVSDPAFVLLRERGAEAPLDIDKVLGQMVGSLTFTRQAPVALYWESYGFAPGDTVDVEIRIARRDENSALRTLGAALGVADGRRDSISIKWREPDPGRAAAVIATSVPTVARTLAIDLRNLAAGTYAFIIEMTRPDGTRARGERRIEVLE